jgi:hypothetical protein
MARILGVLLAIVLSCGTSTEAFCWGSEGHRIVGAIADVLIANNPTAQAKVKALLNNRTLSEVAVFADCAKGHTYCNRDPSPEEDAYTEHNHKNHDYHYTDIPFQQNAYVEGSAGAPSYDVVHVIRYAIAKLQKKNPTDDTIVLTEPESVWVLAHLVGDIHQPLHVGAVYYNNRCTQIVDPNVGGANLKNFGIGGKFLGTTGGNDLMYTASENLHHFWDSVAVTGAEGILKRKLHLTGHLTPQEVAQAIVNDPPAQWDTAGDPATWPEKWATQSLVLSQDALTEPVFDQASVKTDEHGTTCTARVSIDQEYRDDANKKALAQLGRAGFRLNALLVKIFGGN